MESISLPSRRKEQRPRIYKFSELLHQNYDVLKSNAYSGVYLDDLELVKNNLDFINKLIDIKYNVAISTCGEDQISCFSAMIIYH